MVNINATGLGSGGGLGNERLADQSYGYEPNNNVKEKPRKGENKNSFLDNAKIKKE
jgi:hypothetical protein